ncbi:hypothetical protein GH714_006907 [Hevea brasiliensis]|uniref:Uncharacterized protein n=1 Tax=Hevea brasiliensis TaxID=3981 RepID=A0A6A6KNG7_HEVBR|nr:hypothetical protein GH714_006907 [Hevea brasiliensis]
MDGWWRQWSWRWRCRCRETGPSEDVLAVGGMEEVAGLASESLYDVVYAARIIDEGNSLVDLHSGLVVLPWVGCVALLLRLHVLTDGRVLLL